MVTGQIYLLVLLFALSAFFSASETAIVGISKLRVFHLVEKKKKGAAALMKLKEDPHKTLTTILIGNNIVNVSASVLATSIFIQLFNNISLGIVTGVITLVLLVFCEITPKSLATAYRERFALFTAKPISWLNILLFPITWLFDKFTGILIRKAPKRPLITEEEIESIIRAGEESGAIDEGELKMIQRVFNFDDISVSEIMTPRPDMAMISADSTLRALARIVSKHPFSRIPVYEKSRDNIVGIVFTKDLLKYRDLSKKVKSIMGKIHFIPETQKLDTLLSQFKKKGESMAIVVDEHGTIVGLVTMEDVLEEIVGEIVTEKDKIKPCVRKTGNTCWIVEGKTDIDVVNDKLKSGFREGDDFETIGGYVLNKLERIPKEGDKIDDGNYTISVEKLEGRRIKEIKVEKKK
ncbi:MAG: hemolysin family protein [Nanoarchaeota archaeon]|nr:hemolysin family protein [Nanoarchaeota archaeon]MBU1004691.1 hemolysin family protein [Nanoarchaeota archaeon]MBU1945374.1 hemolysin family protein [Nanoarchaeota archaeon]